MNTLTLLTINLFLNSPYLITYSTTVNFKSRKHILNLFTYEFRVTKCFLLIHSPLLPLRPSTNVSLQMFTTVSTKYRVSIKSFPDYKHVLQENYVEYKHIFLPLLKLNVRLLWLKLHSTRRGLFLLAHWTWN